MPLGANSYGKSGIRLVRIARREGRNDVQDLTVAVRFEGDFAAAHVAGEQVTLAQQLGMEGPSLVRLLDKLSASDLVRRECDASDRRANLLWLTDKGEALVSQLETQLIGLRQDVFGELSVDELRTVLKLWQLLADAADRVT